MCIPGTCLSPILGASTLQKQGLFLIKTGGRLGCRYMMCWIDRVLEGEKPHWSNVDISPFGDIKFESQGPKQLLGIELASKVLGFRKDVREISELGNF